MTTLLALETATDICSVAVWQDGYTQIETTLTRPRSHAERLVPMIGDALGYCGLSADDVDGVIVSRGPGSYTGLRIGVSVAKGFAFARQIPLVGVSSLRALATRVLPYATPGDMVATAFHARRNEVYLGLFEVTPREKIIPLDDVRALQSEAIPAYISKFSAPKRWLAGEGARLVADTLKASGDSPVDLLPEHIVSPSASAIARLGAEAFAAGRFEDLAAFEPFYLKEFIPRKQAKSVFDRLPF